MTRACFTALCVACAATLAVLATDARAQSLERIFSAGNEAYFRGDFAGAIRHYERLTEAGVHDADVYFNLGTARARLGDLGHAVLYFERCRWLRAGDQACEDGLDAARGELGKQRAERDGQATVQARPPLSEALVAPLSANGLGLTVLVLDVLFFAALLARARVRRDAIRLGLTIALSLIALVLLASGAGLALKARALSSGEPAIVLHEGAELREGPDPKAQVRANAHEGDRAEVLRREGGFARVALSQGPHGWIDKRNIEQIRPD